MTEEDWLASINPRAMIEFVLTATVPLRTRWQGWAEGRRFWISPRKLRLIACACCAKVVDLLPGNAHRRLLGLAEKLAEGEVEWEQLGALLHRRIDNEWQRFLSETPEQAPERWTAGEARQAVLLTAGQDFGDPSEVFDRVLHAFHPLSAMAIERERADMADLVRDVLGNPFRHEQVPRDWLMALDGTVIRLAQTIHEERAYRDLPVLGDALEEAGCANEVILSHCREGGHHVRGCWVVDIILAKDR
jgi:hypothetical protein